MPVKDITIRAQTLDGVWEEIGSNRAQGVWPEGVRFDADDWGPSRASFTVHRDPRRNWPDLSAFAPVEVDVGGVTVWDGRIIETPANTQGLSMTVSAEGWQNHLDDDVYTHLFLETDLTRFRDHRSYAAEADLTRYLSAGTVTVGAGGIVMGFPQGAAFNPNIFTGVVFDAGPGNFIQAVAMNWEVSAAASGATTRLYAFTDDTVAEDFYTGGVGSQVGGYTLATTTVGDFNSLSSGYYGATGSSLGGRYLHIVLDASPAQSSYATDTWVKITGVRIANSSDVPPYKWFTSSTTGQSTLLASDIINDAVSHAPLLSTSTQVTPTVTIIPSYNPTDPQTPRQRWLAADAQHAWDHQVKVGRIPYYAPKASQAIMEVGAWASFVDDDASANSGEDIYNRVLVTGQTPAGDPVVASRYSGQAADFIAATSQIPNPSFDTNTTGWTPTGTGTITRTTTIFDTSPAAGSWSHGTGTLGTTLTGSFLAGSVYRLTFKHRPSSGALTISAYIKFGALGANDFGFELLGSAGTTFTGQTVSWVPRQTYATGVTVQFEHITTKGGSGDLVLDSFALDYARPTLVSRRGFIRSKVLPISAPLPKDLAVANTIGDVWLPDHKATPFRGTLTVTGNASARMISTGAPVSPERMGMYVGQLIRFTDRVDPDTGNWGREGRIVGVSYDAATDTASVTIDSSRKAFEALIQRVALFTGG
ncbi:MAG: hypothetical protein H0W81_06515 [Chloroflexi bacterium]|nr:hypothetical protein [Chloroflexota bacterium]